MKLLKITFALLLTFIAIGYRAHANEEKLTRKELTTEVQKLRSALDAAQTEIQQIRSALVKANIKISTCVLTDTKTAVQKLFIDRTAPSTSGQFGDEQGFEQSGVKLTVSNPRQAFPNDHFSGVWHVRLEDHGKKIKLNSLDFDADTEKGQTNIVKKFCELVEEN